MKLLFVCLGNICRSPAAEAIMRKLLTDHKLNFKYTCDSAGTAAYHQGSLADPRIRSAATKAGYNITSQSRPFDPKIDFNDSEHIFTMDENNFLDIKNMTSSPMSFPKIKQITSFCTKHDIIEVPDPYHRGDEGFSYVIDILEDACQEILTQLILPVET